MPQLITSKLAVLRASVVLAALFSLCVSSNVGPRFVPLPALEPAIAQSSHDVQGTTASRAHANEFGSFRVPMAQAQKRADREPESRSPALMSGVEWVLSNFLRVPAHLTDPKLSVTATWVPAPSGRAPPVI